MGRRFKVSGRPNSFVERGSDGTFQNWVNIGDSLRADRRVHAKTVVKPGYGHQGDQKRRTVKNKFADIARRKTSPKPKQPQMLSDVNGPFDFAGMKSIVHQFKRNFPFRLPR